MNPIKAIEIVVRAALKFAEYCLNGHLVNFSFMHSYKEGKEIIDALDFLKMGDFDSYIIKDNINYYDK